MTDEGAKGQLVAGPPPDAPTALREAADAVEPASTDAKPEAPPSGPEGGDRGRAKVRVLADGKDLEVPGLAALAAGKPVPVRADVAGAKELTLEVDFGPAGGVRAVVNWADARLVE